MFALAQDELSRLGQCGRVSFVLTLILERQMSISIAEVEAQALLLSPEDRAQLADKLLASLAADTDVADAWSAEAERRLAELERGAISGIPVQDAIARARDAIR